MPRKPFIVFVCQRYESCIRLQFFNDGAADQFRRLLRDFDDDTKATLSLHHRHNGPLVVGANDCVALPMTHLLSELNMHRSVAQGASVRDLAPSVPTARLALSLLLLAAKVLPQRAASSFVRVNMPVKRLMADWQLASNLLRAPLQFKQAGGLLSHPRWHGGSVPALLRTLGRNCTGLLWPVAFKAPIARNLPADGRFVSIKQLGDLSLIVSGFHKGVDLISFNLAEMFVVHGQLRLAGQEALEC